MSCCSSSSNSSSDDESLKRQKCPESSTQCIQVPYSTVLQHVKKPWMYEDEILSEKAYYFCTDPECDVVYFTGDNFVIKKTEIRTLVGIKESQNNDALACYCFDITLAEAKSNNALKQYVIDKTKNKVCSCEIRNPSGRCCLKDFPK